MKKFALLLSLVFVAGVAVADEAKKPEAPKAPEKAVATKTEANTVASNLGSIRNSRPSKPILAAAGRS